MMADYIKREDVVSAIYSKSYPITYPDNSHGIGLGNADIIDLINSIPSADVQPVVHGEWIPFEFGDYHWHKCSICGIADQYIITTIRSVNGEENSIDIEAVRNFCSNCGADMRGET